MAVRGSAPYYTNTQGMDGPSKYIKPSLVFLTTNYQSLFRRMSGRAITTVDRADKDGQKRANIGSWRGCGIRGPRIGNHQFSRVSYYPKVFRYKNAMQKCRVPLPLCVLSAVDEAEHIQVAQCDTPR